MKSNRLLAAAALSLVCAACGRGVEITPISTSPSTDNRATASTPVETMSISGAISAIDLTARTIVVSNTTIAVPATATVDGGRDGAVTFADLEVGWVVEIRATRSGSTVTATAIAVVDRGVPHVSLDGRIAALKGTCPAVTLTVGSATVVTTASTVFSGATCAKLAVGDSVTVDGTLQADNSISASRVSARTNP